MKLCIPSILVCALFLYLPAAANAGTAVEVRSCLDHSGSRLCLDMGTNDGVEPRQGGILELEIDLDDAAGCEGGVIVDCSAAWSGSASVTLGGNTATVTFDTALPDQAACTVELSCDAPVCVRGLEGDIDRNGTVTTSDASIIKPHFGETATDDNAEYDFDLSGLVSTSDFSVVKPLFGNTAPDCPTGEVTRTELAGNSLAEYPYFEYVKAFNEDSTVEVAIDPTRFPDIVGQTCDIYVVEAKTAGAWTFDPSLVDVTAGGAQAEVFVGGTIQANTFTVTGAYELDADAGLGLGVGYDVVLDCDLDGELGGGDYIDGLSNEAGLFMVHDTTAPGPLAVTELSSYSVGTVFGIPASYTNQNTFYPTDIASMGELPLIAISHGNGHDYQWYDHIGNHMASYGYVVMSHQNNTGPGIEECSVTTLGHTDALLDQLDSIGGGVLEGHIDSHRITWIGHSRGAEGIARAYDRIHDSDYSHGAVPPTNYSIDDLVLLSSMLPVDFLGPAGANPHGANYHLWTASGDADVSGDPGNDIAQTFHLHDRATGYRMSTVVQGAGHGDFHSGSGGDVFTGPCHITPRSRVHDIQKGFFLPLIKHYVEGNIPGHDFLWRQWEHFKPIGAPEGPTCSSTGGDTVVVSHTYRNGDPDGKFVIDDYQTSAGSPIEEWSSSGGAVTYTVTNLYEGRLDDGNTSFTWMTSDPMNGFTYGRSTDTTRGVVFDWNDADLYYEWAIIPSERDFTDDLYLSFRAAQGTRHPYTIAVIEDLTFAVTLRDGAGTTSSINIGAYGGGLEELYQRTGEGTGAGWHNEFETIRMRLTDFLTNASGLDLTDVVAVRLDVGPSWGSSEGRIGLDDVELTNDHPPFFVPLTMTVPGGAPEFLDAGVPTVVTVEIDEGSDTLVTDSVTLHYRYDGGAFQTIQMDEIGAGLYEGALPPPDCGDQPEFYFSAEGAVTGPVYQPLDAPATVFIAFVGQYILVMADDFATDQGWTVVDDPSLSSGSWERGLPADDGTEGDPTEDYDGSGQCYLTGNWLGNSDVDGGPTSLISPTLDMSTTSNPVLRYARWWANDDQDEDPFDVEISNNDGGSWTLIEQVTNTDPEWVERAVYVTDYITLTSTMKVRFSASDNPNNSKDEGGVDAVEIFDIACP